MCTWIDGCGWVPAESAGLAKAVAAELVIADAKRPNGASLIVVADYDTVNHQLTNGRLANGPPRPKPAEPPKPAGPPGPRAPPR